MNHIVLRYATKELPRMVVSNLVASRPIAALDLWCSTPPADSRPHELNSKFNHAKS